MNPSKYLTYFQLDSSGPMEIWLEKSFSKMFLSYSYINVFIIVNKTIDTKFSLLGMTHNISQMTSNQTTYSLQQFHINLIDFHDIVETWLEESFQAKKFVKMMGLAHNSTLLLLTMI